MEFKRVPTVFKREGVFDPWIFDTGIVMVSDHIIAQMVDNRDGSYCEEALHVPNLLMVQVDDYVSPSLWDGEEWAERQATLFAPATRACWRLLHAIARKLQISMPAVLDVRGRLVSFAPGSVSVLEIS